MSVRDIPPRSQHGVALVTPLPADTSAQARAGSGYDRSAFAFDYDTHTAICPQGHHSARWNPAVQRGQDVIVVTFAAATCGPCPVRHQCTSGKRGRRQITIGSREYAQAQAHGRAQEKTRDWQADYARRAGVEGTMRQAVAVTGSRRARYRGLPKTRFEHSYSAVALNLIRLDAYWNGRPLDRTRTSHLARLELDLAA